MPQTIGQPLRRKEDLRLLTGSGRYSDDVNLPGQAYAYVLRSPHAHARIRGIDTAAARAMPGVLAVLTGADVEGRRPEGRPAHADPDEAAGRHPADQPGRLARMATRRRSCCRPTGSAMSASRWSMVVAESIAAAKDAAERVVGGLRDARSRSPKRRRAAQAQAPRLYDHIGNVCVDADVGDVEATKAAFARATHVAKLDTWVHRVTGVPLDARAAVGVYDPATKKYTLHAGSGGVVRQKARACRRSSA